MLFTEEDKISITQLEERLDQKEDLEATVHAAASADKARVTFNLVVNDMLAEMIKSHFKFYKQVNDDEDFAERFLAWLFERYMKRKQVQ